MNVLYCKSATITSVIWTYKIILLNFETIVIDHHKCLLSQLNRNTHIIIDNKQGHFTTRLVWWVGGWMSRFKESGFRQNTAKPIDYRTEIS